jgi:hypothetical protein
MALFPDVPDVPGVPPVPRDPSAAADSLLLLVSDAVSLFLGSGTPQWGLFLNGAPAVVAESVQAFGFRKGFSISTYPLELGSFESFNKVQRPFSGRLRFSTGGSISDRQALLDSIDQAVTSLDLFDIVTPEAIYTSANPVSYDYDRSAVRGNGLLSVDVICEEVRTTAQSAFSSTSPTGSSSSSETPTGAFPAGTVTRGPDLAAPISSPQSPSAMPPVNGGTVQPSVASPGEFDLDQTFP